MAFSAFELAQTSCKGRGFWLFQEALFYPREVPRVNLRHPVHADPW